MGAWRAGLGYATWRRFDGAKQMLSAIAVLGVALLLPLQIADTGRLLPIMFPLAGIGVALGLVALTEVLATRVTVTLATVTRVAIVCRHLMPGSGVTKDCG